MFEKEDLIERFKVIWFVINNFLWVLRPVVCPTLFLKILLEIQKILSHGHESKHHMCFYDFFVNQDYYSCVSVAVVITVLVELVGDLVLVLIFWLGIIKCGWFFMLGIIASNFLKIGNGWAIVVKYATTVVYVGTQFFPQLLENSRSHSNV